MIPLWFVVAKLNLTGSPIIPNLEVTPESNSNEPYLPYYQYLVSKRNSQLPQVISTSYGDDEQVTDP